MEKSYAIKQDYIAYKDQKVFKVSEPFVMNGLDVYVNGVLKIAGQDQDYIMLPDISRIIFNNGLSESDNVSIRSNVANNNITVVSYGRRDKTNALFQRYTENLKLKYNNRYHIKLSLQNKTLEYSFATKLNPMFCSPKKIFEDIGQFIEGYTEEYISSMIHRNSLELIDLVNELANSEEEIQNVTIDQNKDDGLYTSTYKVVGNWVRFKTEIDLIYAKYYAISAKYGTEEKSIGDISISKTTKLPYLDELLGRLNRSFDAANETIRGGYNYIGSVVKAGSTYKYSERGTF